MFKSNSCSRSNPFLATLVTLAICLSASTTGAGEIVPASFTFQFAPADLSTASGTERVYSRLVKHARNACKAFGPGREFWRTELREACQADLIDKVVVRIGQPELSARHRSSAYFNLARELEEDLALR
jgi:UrcA family protein